MEWIDLKKRTVSLLNEYKFVAIVLLAGLILMLIPSKKTESVRQESETAQEVPAEDLQDSLSALLSTMKDAGRVEVLLTQSQGEKIIYQTDSREQAQEITEDTVIVSGSGKEQNGLVQQIIPPKYQGAVVLCQGADKAAIRLAIVEAVSSATGLPTDKITVLKMK